MISDYNCIIHEQGEIDKTQFLKKVFHIPSECVIIQCIYFGTTTNDCFRRLR